MSQPTCWEEKTVAEGNPLLDRLWSLTKRFMANMDKQVRGRSSNNREQRAKWNARVCNLRKKYQTDLANQEIKDDLTLKSNMEVFESQYLIDFSRWYPQIQKFQLTHREIERKNATDPYVPVRVTEVDLSKLRTPIPSFDLNNNWTLAELADEFEKYSFKEQKELSERYKEISEKIKEKRGLEDTKVKKAIEHAKSVQNCPPFLLASFEHLSRCWRQLESYLKPHLEEDQGTVKKLTKDQTIKKGQTNQEQEPGANLDSSKRSAEYTNIHRISELFYSLDETQTSFAPTCALSMLCESLFVESFAYHLDVTRHELGEKAVRAAQSVAQSAAQVVQKSKSFFSFGKKSSG